MTTTPERPPWTSLPSTTSRAIAICAAASRISYDVAAQDPDLQITDADLSGSRRLVITHHVRNGILLDKTEAERTLQYLAQLWGYRVKLIETDGDGGRVLKEHEALPMP